MSKPTVSLTLTDRLGLPSWSPNGRAGPLQVSTPGPGERRPWVFLAYIAAACLAANFAITMLTASYGQFAGLDLRVLQLAILGISGVSLTLAIYQRTVWWVRRMRDVGEPGMRAVLITSAEHAVVLPPIIGAAIFFTDIGWPPAVLLASALLLAASVFILLAGWMHVWHGFARAFHMQFDHMPSEPGPNRFGPAPARL